jgi:hypothetical protein
MNGINKILLEKLIEILEPFKDATEELEKFKEPTLHKVLYLRNELFKHLNQNEQDSSNIKAIKKALLKEFLRKWVIIDIHAAASILCPVQKGNLLAIAGLTEQETDKGIKFIKRLVQRGFMMTRDENPRSVEMGNPSTAAAELPAKRLKFTNILKNYNKNNVPESVPVERELSQYMEFDFAIDSDYDILNFWKMNSQNFKCLAYAARCILAVPASSSKCESDFSLTGRIKTKSRASIKPESLDSLLMIRTNTDLCGKLV